MSHPLESLVLALMPTRVIALMLTLVLTSVIGLVLTLVLTLVLVPLPSHMLTLVTPLVSPFAHPQCDLEAYAYLLPT